MFIRTICFTSMLLAFLASPAYAQFTAADQDLELNLDQFPDTSQQQTEQPKTQEMELNLEQFDTKTEETNLELNLDQFEKNNQGTAANQSTNADSSLNLEQFEKTDNGSNVPNGNDRPKYKYLREFIVGGLFLLAVLIIFSRMRRKR